MGSINLPLILTIAVGITGAIWLFDFLFLAKGRREKVAAVDAQFGSAATGTDSQQRIYAEAKSVAEREPVLVEYAKSFFPVLFIVFVLRSFLFEPFQIPSGSMIPTLQVGDFIAVNKFTYGIREPISNKVLIPVNKPKRGDVVVFFPPHAPTTYYIKRLIGEPGDRVSYIDHVLTINGKVVEEREIEQLPAGAPYLRHVKETIDGHEFSTYKHIFPGSLSMRGEWVVPDGHYLFMGDNRDNSSDGREWGMVSEEKIVGKAVVVWMHWHEFFSVPSFSSVRRIQ